MIFRMRIMRKLNTLPLLCAWISCSAIPMQAQEASKPAEPASALSQSLITPTLPKTHGLGAMIEQFVADTDTVQRRFRVPLDAGKVEIQKRLLQEWHAKVMGLPFETLGRDAQVDAILLRNEIDHRLATLDRERERDLKASKWIPYRDELTGICSARENVTGMDPEELAAQYQKLATLVKTETSQLAKSDRKNAAQANRDVAMQGLRAAQIVRNLKQSLDETHRFYHGYDPSYSWWSEKPYQELTDALGKHAQALSKHIAGLDEEDKDKIVGLPIGNEALTQELQFAMIPYSAAELVEIAEREFAWCDAESKRAADDLGLQGDWKRALEHVKSLHVDPGQQPALIRELAWEAIRFLEANDLVTVPPLAANGWRMDMMTPEAQRVNPYFLGGDRIIVSFPTNTMTHAEKLMSLRSNNIHFSRATVHHELIPGHHLQHYMTARYRTYRQVFNTPFWVEGWALYWEMLLWDLEFPKSAEDRVGMLFWRKHRCARIIFSLNYHLGRWTPEECVQYLIERVGHEPSAAAAEVRRSIMGNYGPLYQAAYMLGGLQIRSLRQDVVASGKMNNRQFHDAVIQQNSIPIEMVRAALTNVPLTPDYKTQWRFADHPQ